MRFLIGFEVDIPDAVADQIIRSAGIELNEADYPLALALAVLTPFPAQLRDYLLTPDHQPVPLNTKRLLTTERSATSVALMLSTPNEDSPVWTTTKKSPPSSPAKPSPARKAAKRATGSGSTSKPTKRSGKA